MMRPWRRRITNDNRLHQNPANRLPFRVVQLPCYNEPVINYSRRDVEKQLINDQALWRRVPTAIASLLWPVEIALLGWHTGWWVGALTVALLGVASAAIPPHLRVSVYLIDLLAQVVKLPLEIGWLLLSWHLWMREPIFTLFGQPLAAALLLTVSLWAISRIIAFTTRLLVQQALLGRRV